MIAGQAEGEKKYQNLLKILKKTKPLCVAFSGGIDSTFLLNAAVEALGVEAVTAFFIVSPLQAASAIQSTRKTARENFPGELRLVEIDVQPLLWKQFSRNGRDRCYVCKKKMYEAVLEVMAESGGGCLADGTNLDDLNEDRPGMRALQELEISTPLVEAGFTKKEIRKYAQKLGLSNHDLPSNSCLATRVAIDTEIELDKLKIIEQAEAFLLSLGFIGTRVRLRGPAVIIELQEKDFKHLVDKKKRYIIDSYFRKKGVLSVTLNLIGRT